MKLTTTINIPFELKEKDKPVFYKEVEIGKITDSYLKDNRYWITMQIDSKKTKIIKKLAQLLKQL